MSPRKRGPRKVELQAGPMMLTGEAQGRCKEVARFELGRRQAWADKGLSTCQCRNRAGHAGLCEARVGPDGRQALVAWDPAQPYDPASLGAWIVELVKRGAA